MAVTDWIANLFQSEQTRGLSGGAAGLVALDEANPFYNYRLRRHTADGDLIAEPGLLWYTSAYVARRGGLGVHIASEKGDGPLLFTDVLLILSHEDYSRAVEAGTSSGTPWLAGATRHLQEEFAEFCEREGARLPYPHRQLGFRILCDGSADMGGQSLGLASGEFVTGLLPNLYTGPVAGSHPIIAVLVNLPGVWEGYQEVGRLYDDQVLFTLGNHWLDNFSHPSLQEAALYRLQRYQDGTFVHLISPDLQARFQVTATEQDGASVLTLATREGQPLAYLVLAVIEEEPEDQPDVAPPMLIGDEVVEVSRRGPTTLYGNRTIIPNAVGERIFTLQERGALLQKVHFSAFMEGYDVYVDRRGQMGTAIDEPAAAFQVRRHAVGFIAYEDGALVGGQPVPVGERIDLAGDLSIEIAGQRFEYRDLRGVRVDGWPYVAEIRRPASSTYMLWGDRYRVGRSRECRVVLPDEPTNTNIHWKPKVGDGATIRARTGEIPKANFYTDSIMVASEHALIDLSGDAPRVACTARHCYVFVRRGDETLPLYPTRSGEGPVEMDLLPGDEILIGNCLFHVGYSPGDGAVAPAPAPRLSFTSADALVDAVSEPDIAELERTRHDGDTQPEPLDGRTAPSLSDAPVPMRQAKPSLTDAPAPHLPDLDDPFPGASETSPPSDVDPYDAPTVLSGDDEVPSWLQAPPEPAPTRRRSLLDPTHGRVVAARDTAPDGPDDDVPNDAAHDYTFHEDGPDDAAHDDTFHEDGPDDAAHDDTFHEDDAAHDDTFHQDDAHDDVPDDAAHDDTFHDDGPDDTAPDDGPARADRPEPGAVVVVEDDEAQFELSRRMHLVQIGWMVKGTAVCGNHRGADLVIPENRIEPDQRFTPTDYFTLQARGRRASMTVTTPTEVLVDGAEAPDAVPDPRSVTLDVLRRDDLGDIDFAVRLTLRDGERLPDPRAAFLAIDTADPLTAALFTRGLPTGTPRTLEVGGLTLTARHQGDEVLVTGYLDTYRRGDGFLPFFVQQDGDRFHSAPEDGSPFTVRPGDRLVIGTAVFEIREG